MRKPSLQHILRKFFPLFAIAAFLPFLLFFAMNTVDYDITSRANQESVLRVWYEPTAIVLAPGEKMTLSIVAHYESENQQVHSFAAHIPSVSGLRLSSTEISYAPPFRGKVVVGEVEVTGLTLGSYSLDIPKESIKTSIEDLEVITSPATIDVANE
jgi:hypothetical protein